MTELSVGDVVRLASGGPWMTVGTPPTKGGTVTCSWFASASEYCQSKFKSLSLIKRDAAYALPLSFEECAHQAYVAYGNAAEWKNFRGDPMPNWEDLPENIRSYWVSATIATISTCNTHYNDLTHPQ